MKLHDTYEHSICRCGRVIRRIHASKWYHLPGSGDMDHIATPVDLHRRTGLIAR